MTEPIATFKCEDSLWQMMKDGEKTWDARRWEPETDPRGPALFAAVADQRGGRGDVATVRFVNKKTGETLTFDVLGFHHNPLWVMPDWYVLTLGNLVLPWGELVKEGPVSLIDDPDNTNAANY